MKTANMPGFTAESSLLPTMGRYGYTGSLLTGTINAIPQLQLQPEGAACYWRCRGNGGGDLICRFFCGLRPFTIGGVLIAQ